MIPRTVKEHHNNVRALRCVITNNPVVTLHHCHGGSMTDAGYQSGTAQRGSGSEALVIPLKAEYHVGDEGIDYGIGVITWERYYGTQIEHLKDIGEQLGYDLFSLAKAWDDQPPPRG